MLPSSTIRQIWLIIEHTQAQLILELSDSDLVQKIQKKLAVRGFLSDAELNKAQTYIYSRLPLIRDLAQIRLAAV